LDGNGAMQTSISMHRKLRRYPDRPVLGIDEDNKLGFDRISHATELFVGEELRR
jgi:hypothetical protein